MTQNIFMSYSRRELGFVDDLVSRLEKEGHNVWLDYRVLIPGTPWKGQIDKGLHEADTVLLVVSKASIASQYVELEWRHFLEMDKRLILLIFEAVDLPRELEKYEWVDFRGNYESGLAELFSQLKQPIQEEHPVPETGFKAPAVVWAAIAVSVIVALLSFSELWTIFIPLVLVPLPYRIFKRSFNFTQVQTSLWALPIASLLSLTVYNDPSLDAVVAGGLVFGLVLLFILRSRAMQRWGRPEAIIPKYINPKNPNIKEPTPIPFYVEYAIEDRDIAERLIKTLKKYGHPQSEKLQDAKAVFVLISQFKSDTDADPVQQMVFPILIQSSNTIAEKLSRIQWIDFRPGVRGLDTIAQLLPNPKELLKALGMRPVSSQTVYSPVVTAIYFFIILIAVINVGASLDYMFASDILVGASEDLIGSTVIQFGINMILFGVLAYFMVRGLTSRTGFFSRFRNLVGGVIAMGVLLFWQAFLDAAILEEWAAAGVDPSEIGFSFANAAIPIYILGIVLTALIYFRNRDDIPNWFPARS